jgi:hypothetical protein
MNGESDLDCDCVVVLILPTTTLEDVRCSGLAVC